MALLTAICLLFSVSLVWAWLGRIDIVSTAWGKIQPQGRVKTVQSIETGRVATIEVANGDRVDVGSVLFTLDAAATRAEQTQYQRNADAFRAEAFRRAAAIAQARSATPLKPVWPADLPDTFESREDAVLQSDLSHLRATVRNFEVQIKQKRAERERLEGTITAQTALVSTLKERVDMRTDLLSTGSGAKSGVLDARESYQFQATNLAQQEGQRAENVASIEVAESEISKAIDAFVADNTQKLEEAERQADDYGQKLERARIQGSHMVVTSPIAGVVQALSITTVGQVLNPAEEAMRIVPEKAHLEVEAYMPNKDIGFVRLGQEAVIKVESFPFTRYGTLKGKVIRVASDAVPEPDAQMAEAAPNRSSRDAGIGGGQRTRDLVFPITIELETSVVDADGVAVPVTAGMAVSAEIKTGSRRLIDYLLSPVMEVSSSAMRER